MPAAGMEIAEEKEEVKLTTSGKIPERSDDGDDATLTALDATILRCLDSVDRLLQLRAALSETLAQGWMDMARARYAMGPSRIGQTLFSLKPNAALISVCVSQEHEQVIAYEYGEKELHCEIDEIEKRNHVRFKSIAEQNRNPKTEPMISFGALVSPHLRSAQSSFQTVQLWRTWWRWPMLRASY
ncbi:hypothetical protein O6H91_21G065300 [Diphasiastrum complanatum]|uniref:Uncharacterized protein n=1 Tax=Diphasiastrum complanatum TaxID=34168 RepID=A0ACC2ALC9_DIPCM|nr:hypothetical protein O6H91_21G065300 [Diphasiastrum complanatum]